MWGILLCQKRIKREFCNIQDLQHTDWHSNFILFCYQFLYKSKGLSLTILIPNHSLIIVLILTLIEISTDLQENSGRKYVNGIQSILFSSETIYRVTIKSSALVDIAKQQSICLYITTDSNYKNPHFSPESFLMCFLHFSKQTAIILSKSC
jgi:hypothetical protein